MNQSNLNRVLTLPLLIFYGLGTILGAGIYVLVGKVASQAHMYAPLSFLLSGFIALLSGVSYAELSSRFPVSAGEAVYVQKGFRIKGLSICVGWMVILTGLVSSATIFNGFVGYLNVFIDVPDFLAILILGAVIGGVALWGIHESALATAIITLIEILGLLIVIVFAGDSLTQLPARWEELIPPLNLDAFWGIFNGGFLAFYAFIGFEDMVNVAEEVKKPEDNLPRAIFWALGVSTSLYLIVALIAVLAIPLENLVSSKAPLADIIHGRFLFSSKFIGIISILAITNGALVQIIMASRVLYGMGKKGMAPAFFSFVHPKRHTPVVATLVVTLLILIMALTLDLVFLAQATSFIVLLIFSLVNFSLVLCKVRKDGLVDSGRSYHIFFPVAAGSVCIFMVLCRLLC